MGSVISVHYKAFILVQQLVEFRTSLDYILHFLIFIGAKRAGCSKFMRPTERQINVENLLYTKKKGVGKSSKKKLKILKLIENP